MSNITEQQERDWEDQKLNAFLDQDDLRTLTGYKRPADQIRWLEENGVPHMVNRLNRPVVRRDLETQVAEPELGPIP